MAPSSAVPPSQLGETRLVSNAAAELSVLGGVLLDETQCAQLEAAGLTAEHFYFPSNATVWRAMQALEVASSPIDLVTVADRLHKDGQLENLGGAEWLASIMSAVPSAASSVHYAKMVKEAYVRRQAQIRAQKVIELAATCDHEELLSELEQAAGIVYADMEASNPPLSLKEAIRAEYAELERKYTLHESGAEDVGFSTGIPTSLSGLDTVLGRYRRERTYIVGARPGIGKTAYATQLLVDFGMAGAETAMFTLEMSRPQITRRTLCQAAGVSVQTLEDARLVDSDWARLIEASKVLTKLPVYIDDRKHSLATLRAEIRRMVRQYGVKCVIVDYLQRIEHHGDKRHSTREAEVAACSKALANLAQGLKVCMVAFAQLGRDVSKNGVTRKPVLADLRESGAIEQDADGVILIHRDPNPDAKSEDQEATEFIVCKNRDGNTGPAPARFNRRRVKFEEIARDAGAAGTSWYEEAAQ